MTSILAFKKEGKAYAACDSSVTCGELKQQTITSKMLKMENGYYVFVGGYLRIINLIQMNLGQFNFSLTKYEDALTFAEKIRLIFEKHNLKIDESGFTIIIVTIDSIFKIATDFTVMEIDEVCGEGTGGEICLGVYEVLKDDLDEKVLLKKAIETAAKYVNSCDDRVVYAE